MVQKAMWLLALGENQPTVCIDCYLEFLCSMKFDSSQHQVHPLCQLGGWLKPVRRVCVHLKQGTLKGSECPEVDEEITKQ